MDNVIMLILLTPYRSLITSKIYFPKHNKQFQKKNSENQEINHSSFYEKTLFESF